MDWDLKPIFGVSVLIGLFVWLVKWLRRTIVEVGGSSARPSYSRRESTDDRLAKLFESSGAAAFLATQNGGSLPAGDPRAADARIAENERAVRAQEDALRAAAWQPIAPGGSKALPNAGRMTGVAVTIHCPMCGDTVTDVPTPLPFAAECPGCHRRINARGDGPKRVSIIVIEKNSV